MSKPINNALSWSQKSATDSCDKAYIKFKRITYCMTMNNTVCVRLSDEEKKELQKYGSLSQVLREAMKFYLNNKKSQEILIKLGELQAKNPVKISNEEIVRMIREDRNRW